jgi:hypothetical protein
MLTDMIQHGQFVDKNSFKDFFPLISRQKLGSPIVALPFPGRSEQ